jgi:hypothetical protein
LTLAAQSADAVLAVGCAWDASEAGAMLVQTSGDGVKLDVDLDRVDPSFQGRLSLHFTQRHPSPRVGAAAVTVSATTGFR